MPVVSDAMQTVAYYYYYYYYSLRHKAAQTLQIQYTINKTLKTKKLVRKSDKV